MKYLALGDSMSIDDYTGVRGGGAVNQLARRLGATELVDLTRDGQVTHGVLRDLARKIEPSPQIITLTIGGNDFLGGDPAEVILPNIHQIAQGLTRFGAKVIMNTVYDPTDGDDTLAGELGLAPQQRDDHRALNAGIKAIAAEQGFLLCDLEVIFRGHGIGKDPSWIVMGIEPNHAGATAIAGAWYALLEPR
jgi:lysophospholipase L1-like esterase